jgi:peptide/nickel transport system ATP-binding protein
VTAVAPSASLERETSLHLGDNAPPVLAVSGLKTYFFTRQGIVKAVDDVSFALKRGETLAIVGESGCGKSITALSLMRLIPDPPGRIVGGSITLDGKDLLSLDEEAMRGIRGKDVSMIFQEPMTSLNPVMTIGRQIGEVLRLHQQLSGKEIETKVVELLNLVRIPEARQRLDEYPHQLSGGMRQRVGIARALAVEPEVLLMDEPFGALDAQIRQVMGSELLRIWERGRKTILFVTHDIDEAIYLADRTIVMSASPGRIIADIPVTLPRPRPLEIRNDPAFTAYRQRIWDLLQQEVMASNSWEQPQPAAVS